MKSFYLLILLCACSLSAQTHNYPFQSEAPIANFTLNENDTLRYEGHYRFENAYQVIEDMLTDKRPLDFAESVFAVENCMYDGQLNHSAYLAEIERIASGVQRMALSPAVSAPTPDVALNYAIYLFYTQPCPLNNYHPYEYDKMSLIEDVGLTGGMVTNLLKTGMGTCHSLPYLYKIIADRVGAKAYIALAPLHLYIRHQDAEGKWWNYETTTGTYSRSAWIMESFHVNEKAIRSGLYMTNLSDKETIVQSLYDLLCVYERKTGFYSNDFVRRCYTLGLKYHYADNLHSQRIGDLEYQMKKKAWNKGIRSIAELRNDPVLGREYDYVQQQLTAYEEMGHYAYTQEEYMQKYQEALNYNRTPSDDIRKWLSVDPLADKYPNISPYAYCAWNPVKYVDPDGRDYTVNVDDESGTISIAAKYYVNQQSAPSAQQAADFWNNQSDKFAYLTKDRQYTIQFDLQVETVESPTQALLQDNSGDANAYALYAPSNSNTSGFTANGNQIVVSPIYQSGETGAHEIGHSLGMEHSIYGIMTEAQDSPGRRPEATVQNIGQCISNVFRAYIYNTDAKGTINGSLNKHGRVIKIQ